MTNWVELTSVVASPLAALGGYVLAGFNEEKRDSRTLERERLARLEIHKLTEDDAAREFRLENLLSIQDALQAFARAFGRVQLTDKECLRSQGAIRLLPEDINTEAHVTLINLRRLKERSTTDELRLGINDLVEVFSSQSHVRMVKPISVEDSIKEIDARSASFSEQYDEMNSLVGALIRHEVTRTELSSPSESAKH